MPGLELGWLFRGVREEVMAETGGKQRPVVDGSFGRYESLFFRPASW
jgi:hypothetical protein